jgi:hypothetical protein
LSPIKFILNYGFLLKMVIRSGIRFERFDFFWFSGPITVGEGTPRGWSVENAKAFSAFERLKPTTRGVKFGLFGRTSFALCAKVLRLTQIGPKNQKKIGPT